MRIKLWKYRRFHSSKIMAQFHQNILIRWHMAIIIQSRYCRGEPKQKTTYTVCHSESCRFFIKLRSIWSTWFSIEFSSPSSFMHYIIYMQYGCSTDFLDPLESLHARNLLRKETDSIKKPVNFGFFNVLCSFTSRKWVYSILSNSFMSRSANS